MDNLAYWVWLQLVLPIGSFKACQASADFGSPRALFEASDRDRRLWGRFTNRELEQMRSVPLEAAQNVLRRCDQLGYTLITPDSVQYPQRLRHIYARPAVLYVKGTLPDIDREIVIAMVGTRHATSYGHTVAQRLSRRLAKAGVIVISGGAMGVDADCHNGALQVGGRTIAVLGCGIDYPYLTGAAGMREQISRNGALISEYPPGTPPDKTTFPTRNRLIAALSLGAVIIEAGVKSGSLITAARALEQGRDVFAVPGNIIQPHYAGTNKLIHEGAKPIFCALDVLEEYDSRFPGKLNLEGADYPIGHELPEDVASPDVPFRPNMPQGLSEQAQMVVRAFTAPICTLEQLIENSGLAEAEVLRRLTELEMMEYIEPQAGGRYRLLI